MKQENNPVQELRDVQHFGEEGGVVPVIDVAATSTFLNPEDMERTFRGELAGCYLYSRHSNPTVKMFSKKMAAIEGTEAALGVASGMAAISCSIDQLLPEGGHIVSSSVVYGGTYALFANRLPKRGISVTFVNPSDLKAIESAIRPDTKVVYVETLSNPLLQAADIPAISKITKSRNVTLVVDNTFTPVLVSPIKHGADVVVHSATKYISGASDLIAGVICGSDAFIQSLIDVNHGAVMLGGPVMDPRIAHELYTRLDHLPIRMQAHCAAAEYFSKSLKDENISHFYPGNSSHPSKIVLDKMLNPGFGMGGMVTVDCGSLEKARNLAALLQKEKFGLYAVSLGFSRTLISAPASSTSSEIPEEDQKKMGLTPGLLRLSIGYTGDNKTMSERFIRCYRSVVG